MKDDDWNNTLTALCWALGLGLDSPRFSSPLPFPWHGVPNECIPTLTMSWKDLPVVMDGLNGGRNVAVSPREFPCTFKAS